MVTNKAKETACSKHSAYLGLIYNLGHGIMLTTQIQAYAKYYWGKEKGEAWRDLRELQEAQVIDVHKVQNSSYVKLKKYATRYLLGKNSSQSVKAVTVSFTTLKKSVFVNKFILGELLRDTVLDTAIHCSRTTTLLSKKYSCWNPLIPFKEKTKVEQEVENLKEIAYLQTKNLKSPKDKGLKIEKVNTYNVNNMQSNNVYILEIKKGDNFKTEIKVAMLDVNNNYTAQKIATQVKNIREYFVGLFKLVNLTCVIYVPNATAETRVKTELLTAHKLYKEIALNTMEVKNLELTAQCFNNVEILL